MNLASLQHVRHCIDLDHCYASQSSQGFQDSVEYLYAVPCFSKENAVNGTSANVDVEFYPDITNITDTFVDRLNSNDVDINGNSYELPDDQLPIDTEVRDGLYSSNNAAWVSCEAKIRHRLYSQLKKCLIAEYFQPDNEKILTFTDRKHVFRELRIRKLSRAIRTSFAEFSWHIENCFNLHRWCITQLPQRLLSLYCEAFVELWRQNKVTVLLESIDQMLRERNVIIPPMYEDYLKRLDIQKEEVDLDLMQQSRTLLTDQINHSHLLLGGGSTEARHNTEEIILACMTFPASRNSNRIRRLLKLLEGIGRVSLETAEEQACDSMRIRLRLFVRRLLSLMEEVRGRLIYIIGFGAGTLLSLLSAVHVQSGDQRMEHIRSSLVGIVCIGIPLIGLRGPRGCSNDPLLSIPPLPTLLIVGAESRLGGYKASLDFRRKLLNYRAQSCNSRAESDLLNNLYHKTSMQSESVKPCPSFDLVIVGGSDHLLRMRPSTCVRWCTTQSRVDLEICNAIAKFIRKSHPYARNPPTSCLGTSSLGIHSLRQYDDLRASLNYGTSSRTNSTLNRKTQFSPRPTQQFKEYNKTFIEDYKQGCSNLITDCRPNFGSANDFT